MFLMRQNFKFPLSDFQTKVPTLTISALLMNNAVTYTVTSLHCLWHFIMSNMYIIVKLLKGQFQLVRKC